MRELRRSTVLLLIVLPLLSVATNVPLSGQVLDRSVARVRLTRTASIGQRSLRSQIGLYEQQAGQSLSTEQRREVLEIMINEELIEQAAERDGIEISSSELDQYIAEERRSLGQQMSDEQFRMAIEQQLGLDYEDYVDELRKQLLQQRYIQEKQRSRFESIAEPTEQQIREVYNENITEFINPAMVRFDHIYADARAMSSDERSEARERLEGIFAEISSGETSFDSAYEAAQSASGLGSSDFGYLQQNNRQLRQQLGGSFVDEMFELGEGEVSGVYESSIGLHIVRVTDKRDRRFLNLEDPLLPGQQVTVRDNIRNYILNNRMQSEFAEATQAVLSELRDEAEIDINESNLDW